MDIRRATLDDAPAIAGLRDRAIRHQGPKGYEPSQVEAWAGDFSEERARRLIESFETWVAERDGTVLGYASLTVETGDDVSVYVDSEAQGHGVGRILMERLEASARAAGRREIRLLASRNALGFYRRTGFVDEQAVDHVGPDGVVFACVNMRKPL